MVPPIDRLARGLDLLLRVLLAVLTLLAAAETLAWGLFEHSWPAMQEVEGLLLVWLALLGAAWGVAERFHLAVELLSRRLPAPWRRALDRLAALSVALCGVLLAVYGGALVARVGNTLPATGWPAAVQYVPAAVGGALIAVFALARALTTQGEGVDGAGE